jgi:hypothetical protein
MVEELLQGHLEELRIIRENASRSSAERGVGPDGGEEGDDGDDDDDDGDEDDDLDLDEILFPGDPPASEQPPSNPQTRERSRSPPPQEYQGMYS